MLIVAFSALFVSDLNLRVADPSLTDVAVPGGVVHDALRRIPCARHPHGFTAFFFVALMFGMLRYSGRHLAMLGAIVARCIRLVIALRYATVHDVAVLRLDLLQFIVLAVTVPWFVFIGGRVSGCSAV